LALRLRPSSIGPPLALLLAACGGTVAAPSGAGAGGSAVARLTAPAGDPCALLTQAQVEAALGETVSAGTASGASAPSCSWQDATGGGVTIALLDPSLVGQIASGEAVNSGVTLTAVSGIGDAAVYTVVSNLTAELAVRQGSRAFELSVGVATFSLAQIEGAEKTLALDALAQR
jgi:hypothetical protein